MRTPPYPPSSPPARPTWNFCAHYVPFTCPATSSSARLDPAISSRPSLVMEFQSSQLQGTHCPLTPYPVSRPCANPVQAGVWSGFEAKLFSVVLKTQSHLQKNYLALPGVPTAFSFSNNFQISRTERNSIHPSPRDRPHSSFANYSMNSSRERKTQFGARQLSLVSLDSVLEHFPVLASALTDCQF